MITTISQLIAQTESAGNKWAIRFEPGFHPSTLNVKRCIDCAAPATMSFATAETLCASSWSLYQIMGENVYDLGYRGNFLDYFVDEQKQLDIFNRYLQSRQIDYDLETVLNDQLKRENFARKYNGSAAYADRLLAIYHRVNG